MGCENTYLLKGLLFIDSIVNILKIIVPIALIILASVDLAKNIFASDESDFKKIRTKLLSRVAAAIIVFFVPTMVGIVLNLIGDFSPVIDACRSNANGETIDLLERLTKQKADEEPEPTPDNSDSDKTETLVVGTFNIGHANKYSGVNGSIIGKKIDSLNFDIVGMQEVSKSTSLTKKVYNNSGMKDYFHTATSAGNAILSMQALSGEKYNKLKTCGRDSMRAVQKTVIKVNDKNISFYNVHLDPSASCRDDQAKGVVNVLKKDSNPIILVGDFNYKEECDTVANIFKDYDIVAHDTIHKEEQCTDLVIISKNKGISKESDKTYETNGTLSDHNIVKATLKIK